jgi:hypothetical protein
MKTPTINLKKATLQRIFEFGLRHIRKQGGPSLKVVRDSDGSVASNACMYRGPEGVKCVVGAMLTDAQLAEIGLVEGNSLAEGTEGHAKMLKFIGSEKKLGLLRRMQAAHDMHASSPIFMGLFEDGMRECAAYYKLTYKPVGTILRA